MEQTRKIIFIGGWTRDKGSYNQLFTSAPLGYEIIFISCHDLIVGNDNDFDFSALERAFDKEKFILAAHSLGGIPAIEYSLLHSAKIEKLVLIDSAGIGSKDSNAQILWRSFRAQLQNSGKKIVQNLITTKNAIIQPKRSFSTMHMAHRKSLIGFLPQIRAETLILWGEADHIYGVEQAQMFNNHIGDSSLIIFPGMDHDWIIHNPELFWSNIT